MRQFIIIWTTLSDLVIETLPFFAAVTNYIERRLIRYQNKLIRVIRGSVPAGKRFTFAAKFV